MFTGLPGGSPGPNATATWVTFFFVVLTAIVVATALALLIIEAARVGHAG